MTLQLSIRNNIYGGPTKKPEGFQYFLYWILLVNYPRRYRPLIFEDGDEIPFPQPDAPLPPIQLKDGASKSSPGSKDSPIAHSPNLSNHDWDVEGDAYGKKRSWVKNVEDMMFDANNFDYITDGAYSTDGSYPGSYGSNNKDVSNLYLGRQNVSNYSNMSQWH